MYGESGPPKGYSVPRNAQSSAKRLCQTCKSKEHWTFECPTKKGTKKETSLAPKLSKTQMLKYGITPKKSTTQNDKRKDTLTEKSSQEGKDGEVSAVDQERESK